MFCGFVIMFLSTVSECFPDKHQEDAFTPNAMKDFDDVPSPRDTRTRYSSLARARAPARPRSHRKNELPAIPGNSSLSSQLSCDALARSHLMTSIPDAHRLYRTSPPWCSHPSSQMLSSHSIFIAPLLSLPSYSPPPPFFSHSRARARAATHGTEDREGGPVAGGEEEGEKTFAVSRRSSPETHSSFSQSSPSAAATSSYSSPELSKELARHAPALQVQYLNLPTSTV